MPDYTLVLIRSIISFILLLALTRAMGKKQLSQLTFFDYVIGITIGSIAASMSVDLNISIFNGLFSLVVWGLFSIILSYFSLRSRKFQSLSDGKPSIIIKDGKVLEEEMKKNFLTIDELMMLLREKDVFELNEVEEAVFETNGNLSILKKKQYLPITPTSLNLNIRKKGSPSLLIVDGHLLSKNLSKMKITEEWLASELKKRKISSYEDVFIAQIDTNKTLYIDLYDDRLAKKKTENE